MLLIGVTLNSLTWTVPSWLPSLDHRSPWNTKNRSSPTAVNSGADWPGASKLDAGPGVRSATNIGEELSTRRGSSSSNRSDPRRLVSRRMLPCSCRSHSRSQAQPGTALRARLRLPSAGRACNSRGSQAEPGNQNKKSTDV